MRVFAKVFLGAIAISSIAFADAESDAKDLFVRGRALRERGDCAAAAPLFRRAWEVFPKGLGSLRNLAECEQQQGHYASSRRAWLDLSRALLIEQGNPKYKGWEEDAKREAQALAAKVAVLRVDIDVATEEATAPATKTSPIKVLMNGDPMPIETVGVPLDRDPGTYVVRVEAERADPVERTVELVPGRNEVMQLTIRIRPEPKQIVKITNAPPPPEPKYKTSPAMVIGGWVTASVGVLALGGSAIAFGIRQDAMGTLQSKCPSYATTPCPRDLEPTVSRGSTAAGISTGLLIGGAITLAVGLTLVLVSPAVKVRADMGSLEWRFH